MLKVRIHCGAREIGGNCIELDADGTRLVLDVGRPLGVSSDTEIPLPPVSGLRDGNDPSLAGLVISHPHQDHYGLAHLASPKVPIYLGEAAHRILREASFFTPAGLDVQPAGFLRHRQTFDVGPFRLTPFLNDHSAFDAYSLLIEAGGRRVFYTGDVRGHGRKAGIFEELLRRPPADIDVLLMEGTHVRPDSDGTERGPTERDVEDACVDTFQSTRGAILACYSAQNIDCLVTLYRAALRTGRDLVMDLYTATIAAATGCRSIPQPGWDRVRVYLPRAQRSKVMAQRAFARTDAVRPYRIFPEELAARGHELVITFRGSMAAEFERVGCVADAHLVWALWPGYLRQPTSEPLLAFLERHRIPLTGPPLVRACVHPRPPAPRRRARAARHRADPFLRDRPLLRILSARNPALRCCLVGRVTPHGDRWRGWATLRRHDSTIAKATVLRLFSDGEPAHPEERLGLPEETSR